MPRPEPDVVRSIEQSLSAAIKHVIKLDIAAAQRPNFIGQCLLAQLDGNQPPSAAAHRRRARIGSSWKCRRSPRFAPTPSTLPAAWMTHLHCGISPTIWSTWRPPPTWRRSLAPRTRRCTPSSSSTVNAPAPAPATSAALAPAPAPAGGGGGGGGSSSSVAAPAPSGSDGGAASLAPAPRDSAPASAAGGPDASCASLSGSSSSGGGDSAAALQLAPQHWRAKRRIGGARDRGPRRRRSPCCRAFGGISCACRRRRRQ